jgi:hypothetical protein
VPTSIYDATDNDIWPDPAGRPPCELRAEIRRVAQDEVAFEDVEASGLTFAPWFSRFYLAQGIVQARLDAAKTARPTPPPAPATDPEELRQLRRRVAKLERMVLGEKAILLKAVGTVLGETHGELEDRIKVLEDREPVALPVPDWNNPTVHYCGLWNAKHLYGPGALVTYNGAGWIAMSAMGAGVRPGAGETGWRLAIKSDTSALRSIVKDEVRKQLRERAG